MVFSELHKLPTDLFGQVKQDRPAILHHEHTVGYRKNLIESVLGKDHGHSELTVEL